MIRQIELIKEEKIDYINLSGGSFEDPKVGLPFVTASQSIISCIRRCFSQASLSRRRQLSGAPLKMPSSYKQVEISVPSFQT